jgi:outer membrane protein OmpA-like peptidoglycan-associated protein
MKATKDLGLIIAGVCTGTLVACAATLPPQELVNARTEYEKASTGTAQQLNPADVHEAKSQLDVAEASFSEEGDTQTTRDKAYLAQRQAQLAMSVARTRKANASTDNVIATMHADERETMARTSAELDRTKDKLATSQSEAAAEKTRREDAEKRAAQAAADLARIATVKQEARGMVITLSGGVLFESAKSDLLPAAQVKLNDVAKALTEVDPLSRIVVEGHTDSQGGADFNQLLSQRRAGTVREYLVSHGVAADRITAQGLGLSRPIADNTSAEGRANNRRVEIVVQSAP